MIAAAALLMWQAAAPQAVAGRDVVVTARPLAATEKAWRDCLARSRPPNEEVAAALAHAENLFVAGNVLGQRIEIGDAYAQIGRPEDALDFYDAVEERAAELGLAALAGQAMLRRAMLHLVYAEDDRSSGAEARARESIARLTGTTDPALAPFREAAGFLAARLRLARGDEGALAKWLVERRLRPGPKPVLLHAPAVDPNAAAMRPMVLGARETTSAFDDQWIDISFWVAPDGTVRDASVLRSAKALDRAWVGPVLAAVARRRYAPLDLPLNHPGLPRVERVTYTSWYNEPSGPGVRTRSGVPTLLFLDLTEEDRSSRSGE